MDTVYEICAGLDVHKDSITANVRHPGERGRRAVSTRETGTTTRELLGLAT